MFTLTVDQRDSGRSPDLVEATIDQLSRFPARLALERTAGDEFQGLFDDPQTVLDVVLELVRADTWHIGIGCGDVEHPLPASTRAARGPAYELARQAVEKAKRRPQHLCVAGADEYAAGQADAVLTLLAALTQRRSEQAWEAIDLRHDGFSNAEIAAKLEISRQAVGQRLAAGLWNQESGVRPVIAELLTAASGTASRSADGETDGETDGHG